MHIHRVKMTVICLLTNYMWRCLPMLQSLKSSYFSLQTLDFILFFFSVTLLSFTSVFITKFPKGVIFSVCVSLKKDLTKWNNVAWFPLPFLLTEAEWVFRNVTTIAKCHSTSENLWIFGSWHESHIGPQISIAIKA